MRGDSLSIKVFKVLGAILAFFHLRMAIFSMGYQTDQVWKQRITFILFAGTGAWMLNAMKKIGGLINESLEVD